MHNARPTTPNPSRLSARERLLVLALGMTVLVGGLIAGTDDAGATRGKPAPSSYARCGPILVHASGTLYGCSNGETVWHPKPRKVTR